MVSIVYRKLPALPHRQYARRVVAGNVVWHRDRHIALRLSEQQAAQLAHLYRQRSTGTRNQQATEPPGEYGIEEWTP